MKYKLLNKDVGLVKIKVEAKDFKPLQSQIPIETMYFAHSPDGSYE